MADFATVLRNADSLDALKAGLEECKTECIELREKERITSAGRLIETALKELREIQTSDKFGPEASETVGNIISEFESDPKIAEIIRLHALVESFLEDVKSHEGYVLCSSNEDVQVYYRSNEACPINDIRCDVMVNAPITNALCVINETDLWKNFFPYYTFPTRMGLASAEKVLRVRRIEQIIHAVFDIPWPFASREIAVYAAVSDRLRESEDKMLLGLVLPAAEVPDATLPEPRPGDVRIDCGGGCFAQYVEERKTKVTMLLHIDPKIDKVPKTLMTMVVQKLFFMAMVKFKSICESLENSEYGQRIYHNSLVYGTVAKQLETLK
eukprot:Colp12_sorted_trinity150504_noHs@14666